MLEKDYYEGYNINDFYETRKEVLRFIREFEEFDKSVKKFFGPKKVKVAATDARRNLKNMKAIMKVIGKKIQMTRQDYNSNYE